ncbi:MAG: hypothetical protein OXM55_00045 [Bdellovibrionales bacterium]|nr:hypothetical protein [Bdellovibrionales bacterium]
MFERSFGTKKYFLILFKVFSALFVGILISLIGQALMNYGYFSFMFLFLSVFFAFFTLVKKLKILGVLLVDLLFILILVLMKVYIVMADKG